MDIVKKHLTNGQYLTHEYEKKSIFLHHTVSTNAMSAWRWWNSTPERVGTPYIIDRDGSILECFDPKVWAFHLGVKGDDNYHEKHSINIELVSAGPLRFDDDKFIFYPLWPNKLHFVEIPEGEVHILTKEWRGFKYWHAYTDDQLESVKWLIGRLALDFPSLVIDNDVQSMFEFNKEILDNHLPGIWAHCSVREDTSDVFPYPPLIKALKEVQGELQPTLKATRIPEVTVTGESSTVKKTVKKKATSKSGPSDKPKS